MPMQNLVLIKGISEQKAQKLLEIANKLTHSGFCTVRTCVRRTAGVGVVHLPAVGVWLLCTISSPFLAANAH